MMKGKCVRVIVGLMFIILSSASLSYGQEITLKCWDTAAPLRLPFQTTVVENFMKENPEVKVEFEGIPWGGYMEKLITSVAAGMPPDVVRYCYVPTLASKGVIIPLDDYIEGPDGIDKSEYVEGAFGAGVTWKGETYALPHCVFLGGIFYNLDVMDELGATIPKTLEEFNALAKKMTKKDASGKFIRRGLQVSEYGQYIDMWLYNRGARELDQYNNDAKELVINSPEGVQGLTDLVNLYKEGVAISAENEQAFVTGYVGMWATQDVDAYGFRPEAYPEFRFDFSLLPAPKGRESVVAGQSSDATVIPVGTKNKDWAWKLAKAYSSKQATALIWQGKYGTLPPYKDILQKPPAVPAYEFYQNDKFLSKIATIISEKGLGVQWPRWHMYALDLLRVIDDELGNALRDIKSPKQALNDMVEQGNKILRAGR